MQAAGEQSSTSAIDEADQHLSQHVAGNDAQSEFRGGDAEDAELDAMKQRVAEMEAEAAKLREMNEAVEQSMGGTTTPGAFPSEEEKLEIDGRSVYVGNVRSIDSPQVDYGATPEEIQQHFQSCGTINRVTILCDKFTGHPKGFAYVEFADATFVENASALNESLFRGRLLKVGLLQLTSR